MVLLSASVITKAGKPLASRQFVEMSRSRIEGLLAAFPRLLGKSTKQHTFVETDSVRYVYQPLLDKLFMVLITTKTSNILEDLEMLRLFAKVVAEYCHSLEENDVVASSLQLILAFDELAAMGYRENVTLAQIRTFVEMDSQEEKAAIAARLSQEREAKQKMKEKAKELQRQRAEAAKKGHGVGALGRGAGGVGGGGIGGSGGFGSSSFQTAPMAASDPAPKPAGSSYSTANAPARPKGLKLGSKAKEWDQFANQLQQEGEKVQSSVKPSQAGAAAGKDQVLGDNGQLVKREPVHLTCEEKITCSLQRDGGLDSLEVHGLLTLRISEESSAMIRIQLENKDPRAFQFNQHPNIDKELFRSSGSIGLKAPGKPFPINADVGVLKWRLQSNDESLVPLTVNCWVNDNGNGACDCNIEYDLNQRHMELKNVLIQIPVSGTAPVVKECEGEYNFDSRRSILEWRIQLIDSGSPSGNLEFTAGGRPDVFFPVTVEFLSSGLYSQILVAGVHHVESKQPLRYSIEQSFVAEPGKYTIA